MPELIEDTEVETLVFTKNISSVVNTSRHYVDDEQLTKILSEWKKIFDINKAEGIERPRLPESVGGAIYDMAEQTGRRHNFCNYSYLDEMKSDAILHCVKYIHNFNPEKKSEKKGKVSAFGYINMIIWRSFTHRIKAEKQQQYLKYKSFQLMGGMEAFQDDDMNAASGEGGEDSGMSISVLGTDFIAKDHEYEESNGLNALKKAKITEFDSFMFDMATETYESDDELEIEFE